MQKKIYFCQIDFLFLPTVFMNKIFLFLFSFFSISNLFSQNTANTADYFRPPLDIPLYLSGTFGELRANHFHSGIDIKTQGVEGKNVYAVADGYVSRIKVSTGGYGKALYITHPNGTVSVYGHLKKYNKDIEALSVICSMRKKILK